MKEINLNDNFFITFLDTKGGMERALKNLERKGIHFEAYQSPDAPACLEARVMVNLENASEVHNLIKDSL